MFRSAKVRALMAACALTVFFTGFSARLVHLQVRKHDELATLANDKHVNKQPIFARRGLIQDINYETLAENDPICTVVADGSLMRNPAAAAEVLAGPLGLDETALRAKLTTARRYVVLKKQVPKAVSSELENRLGVRSLRGIYFEPDAARIYPNGSMLCHVVGFMNSEHEGVDGIERQMDEYLRGHDGFRFIERDRTGKELVAYRGQERAPRDGCNVRLTVDLNLQNIVETELDTACAQFHPKKAIAILMRPGTGEILALANRPNFDLNDIRTQPASFVDDHAAEMKNCAVTDMMEPGSTFKMVTAAAALNERLVHPGTMIFCENGHFSYGGRVLHDHHGYPELSVEDILMHSSNIGAAKLGLLLGEQRLYDYIRRFGFGERTGVMLPGEISGLLYPPHKWSKLSITRIPMGQEVAVTPLQTITAMSAIANGGHLMMPQIVHEIADDQGNTVTSFPPVEVRQVISSEIARQMRKALQTVVSPKGTAPLAQISGFPVAGKTGTAQKIDPHGGYMSGKYIVSFCGFFPAENPEVVGFVMLDDAVTKPELNYGGSVAAPIFSRIGEKAARYLNLVPQPEPLPNKLIVTQRERD